VWIISRHGLTPLISASQTSLRSVWSIFRLVNIDFVTEEPYLDLLGAMGIIGMAILVSRKNFLIPGMFLVIYLANPRSAHTIGNIPLAMAAGFFIFDILIPSITKPRDDSEGQYKTSRFGIPLFLAVLIPYILSNSLYYGMMLSGKHVSEPERNAMQWIKENTPTGSAFLVITGEPNGFCDSTSEWFPALTNRQSLATLQGNEWLKGNNFGEFIGDIQSLQTCGKEGLDCLTREANHFTPDFDFLYISLDTPTSDCNLTSASDLTRSLILELEHSDQFQPVFVSDNAIVFKKK
jgi:hypothetical protein